MKKPRITDFDPNAEAPKLGSPLDNMPIIQKPTVEKPQIPDQKTSKQGNTYTRMQGNKETSLQVNKNTSIPNQTPTTDLITAIATTPYKKQTFLFLEEELEALDDVKRDLRRSFDIKTSMNELLRIGIHYIADDFKEHGENSILIHLLTKKRSR